MRGLRSSRSRDPNPSEADRIGDPAPSTTPAKSWMNYWRSWRTISTPTDNAQGQGARDPVQSGGYKHVPLCSGTLAHMPDLALTPISDNDLPFVREMLYEAAFWRRESGGPR